MATAINTGDTVSVIRGSDSGFTGRVTELDMEHRTAVVSNGTDEIEQKWGNLRLVEPQPEAEVESLETSDEPETAEPRFCECGCGAEVRTKKGMFAPGHDMKLKSRLLKVVVSNESTSDEIAQARAELVSRGWKSPEALDIALNRALTSANSKRVRIIAQLERVNNQMDKLREQRRNLEIQLEELEVAETV